MALLFNPSIYRGKKQVYLKIPGCQGLCHVYDWNSKKGRYDKRHVGLKFYAYKTISGVQKSQHFESFDQAKKWRESPFLFVPVTLSQEITFAEVQKKFFEHFKSKWRVTTFETYESNSKHFTFFSIMPMKQINAHAIDAWLLHVKKAEYLKLQHHSRLTYQHELSLLKQICTYYGEYLDDFYKLPFKKRHNEDCIVDSIQYQLNKAQSKFRFIPREDCERFLSEMKRKIENKPRLAVFHILSLFQLRTGCRIGEACAIKWDDIDWETGGLSICKTVQWARKKGRPTAISPLTKTGEPRLIYATQQLQDALKEWQVHSGRSKGLVFSENGFAPVSYRSVQHHYNTAFAALGMKWSSTHIMRHSFATDFLEATGDQHALKGQLGHRHLEQTEHYAKNTQKRIGDGMKAYGNTFQTNSVIPLASKKQEKISGGAG